MIITIMFITFEVTIIIKIIIIIQRFILILNSKKVLGSNLASVWSLHVLPVAVWVSSHSHAG